jgi:flagellar hook-length control protein FliK
MGEGGSVSTTPAESASQQNLSPLNALPGELVKNTSGKDKLTSMLQSEMVDEAAGQVAKELKASDQPLQTQEKDPFISQTKPDARFDTISQSLSSAQDMAKAAGHSMASAAVASTEADERTILNQNDTLQTANLDSGSIKGEGVSKPGQSGVVKEKSFTTSAKVGQDPEKQGETLPKTDGQPAGVTSANKVLAEDVKAVADGKGITSTGKPERKMVPEAPPDSPDKAPPETTLGVVTDRIKADPFTGKINEPARLAEAQSTEILRQIGRQIAGSSNNGSQTIRIQLHPEDLGQIELRITSSSQGTQVSLIADQAGTGKLLETHIAQLKQTLSDAGVQMADVHVGQQAPQQSFRDPQSSQNPQQNNSRYESGTVASPDKIATSRSHSNSSLVDYRI